MEANTLTVLSDIGALLARGGPTVALLLLLYAIHAGHLVLRREYQKLEAENDRLRSEVSAERVQSDALLAAASHALDAIAAGASGKPDGR